MWAEFQSTRPSWGATTARGQQSRQGCHFNPRAPRGARPNPMWYKGGDNAFQSTRPSWGATACGLYGYARYVISIHAPLVGRDAAVLLWCMIAVRFQSTRPSWGATRRDSRNGCCPSYFNPRAPRGARPWPPRDCGRCPGFQSTRPSWGATTKLILFFASHRFQSTRPSWGATLTT